MRVQSLTVAFLLVAGCASTSSPVTKPATTVPETRLAGNGSLADVEAAQKAGYKIVSKNGETLYCREELKTGSHVRRDMTCLTKKELEMVRDAARRNVEQMQRATPIPQGK
jgi:predicted outer membrane protein